MILDVRDLGVRRGERRVLSAIDVRVERGTIAALVGANGAGKSTLLAAIAGVLAPDRGAVLVGGASVWGAERERRRARAQLGYVPEAADPPGHLTCDEVLALVAAVKRSAPIEPAVRARLGLGAIANVRIDRMSLGQRRRACLGAALVGAPALLVLDEPDNGLDPAGAETLVSLLRERAEAGAAVVIASHDAGLVEKLGARPIELAGGRVVDPAGSS
ncbi:MAG TPA: ABC transporter ATP-binding protein [Kofleriaceae bacterium]|nr:ABC transporter ATP-binding protein [Kofleriaceae bacterium]